MVYYFNALEMENTNTLYRLPKSPTGIAGMDEITAGGLPLDRTTLLLGSTGCGKTVLAIEYLINGIVKFDEAVVYLTFEESAKEIIVNANSMGYDFEKFISEKKIIYREHKNIGSRR